MPTPIASVDQEAIKEDLRELVRRTAEDTLSGLLGEEAGDLVGAGRHERTAGREAIGAAEGLAEPSERWRGFLSRPKSRGLRGVRTFAGDKAAGMVGTFPDGKSALMLATARLKCVAEGEWGSRRYLDVTLLDE